MRNRTHIHLHNDGDSLYWCVHFDVDHARLRKAIDAVGNEVSAVSTHLRADDSRRVDADEPFWRRALIAVRREFLPFAGA